MYKELFSRMQYEPCIFMLGSNYKKVKPQVLDYAWNMVVTTSCEMEFSGILKNNNRIVQDVFTKQDMQANLLDKRMLHVIRLLGKSVAKEDLDELELEDLTDNAVVLLERVIDIIRRNGIIIIEDFQDSIISYRIIRKVLKNLYANQKQVYIFNYSGNDKYIQDLVEQGIVTTYGNSVNDFFLEQFSDYEENFEQMDENGIHIFIDAEKPGVPVTIDRSLLLESEGFATLLNVNLMKEVRIPHGFYKDYFYLFLKNSVREPQWYGYEYGFNLHRSYEELLYKKTKKGLENVGKPNNKPLLLVGQTGTGKSVALAALAHKIFNEKKYPVIFINNPDVNFYSNIEYKQKEVDKKGSPAFNALDILLENLENMGAKATLLIWDTSSYSAGREKCYGLYQALLSRGRKIYMLSTAYEMHNENSALEVVDENVVEESVLNKKFVECNADIKISDEIEQLKGILQEKCGIKKEHVESIVNIYARQSSTFLSLFYQIFDMLRSDLSKGVYREASLNLEELERFVATDFRIEEGNNVFAIALKRVESDLKDAGIVDYVSGAEEIEKEKIDLAKEEFVKCIAICSKFKLKMPYDFALRILGTYNPQIIKTLSKSTFFVITQDYYGNYEVSIRTPLEASMYLSAKNILPIEEIDCVKTMLNNMKSDGEYGQQIEVRLCERLIRIMGPNNSVNGRRYRTGYEEIIEQLRKIREERGIWEPILVSQEITFIREYYGRDEKRASEERVNWLQNAIAIADKMLSRAEYYGLSAGTRNAIIVETANSKLLLCQLKGTTDTSLYKELRRDLREVIRYDSQDYHAYVTLLKGSIIEYDNEVDAVKQVELLESMCSVADEIIFENADIADSEYFQRQVAEIYSRLVDTNIAQNYVDELAANGSAAGIYVMARKKLCDCDVDFKARISNAKQYAACEDVYGMFHNEKYSSVVQESEPCQYMLLNVLWLMKNSSPIHQSGECWCTSMSTDAWTELLGICNNYIARFCSDAASVYKVDKNIKYMQALCYAQLGQYLECLSALRTIEEDSTIGIKRVFTKHMICDEKGVPKKFTGRLGKYDEIKRSGMVYIDEFGRSPLYYYGPHLNTSNYSEGIVFNDLEVGLSNIAPKVYRNVEAEGGSHGR